jgi:hypothetical protein
MGAGLEPCIQGADIQTGLGSWGASDAPPLSHLHIPFAVHELGGRVVAYGGEAVRVMDEAEGDGDNQGPLITGQFGAGGRKHLQCSPFDVLG